MLLSNLEIQRFRTFDYLHIEKLGQVNLIVGKNNVGKSTVLEAIRLYANLGAPHVLADILESRDDSYDRTSDLRFPAAVKVPAIQHLFNGYPSLTKITEPVSIGPFKSPDSTLNVGISWFKRAADDDGGTFEVLELHDHFSSSELIPALTIKIGSWLKTLRLDRDFEQHIRRWQFEPKTFLDLTTSCVCVGPHGLPSHLIHKLWQQIALSDLEQDVIECLNIVYPGVDAVAVLYDSDRQSTSIRVKHPSFNSPHPLKSLGDGTGRLFGLTLALVAAKDGILLVDEIENGVHYSVLVSLWKFIAKVAKRLNIQVFATSHSLDCVRAFHEVTLADPSIEGVLNRVETRKGEVRSVLFDESKLDRFLDEGIELR